MGHDLRTRHQGRKAERDHFHLQDQQDTQIQICERPKNIFVCLFVCLYKKQTETLRPTLGRKKHHTENAHYLINVQSIDMEETTLIIKMVLCSTSGIVQGFIVSWLKKQRI